MITSLFAALLSVLYFRMSLNVIRLRKKHKISYGYGSNNEIIGPVSAHGNFMAYVPILLVLLYLFERSALFPTFLIYMFGVTIFLGRLLHYWGVSAEKTNFKQRVVGMHLTLWPLLLLSVLNIYAWIRLVVLE